MRCDLSNMLRQVLDELRHLYELRGHDPGPYIASIEQLRSHIEQVREGTATLDTFADLYMLRPQSRK